MPAEKVGRQSIFNCSRTRPCANNGVHSKPEALQQTALQFIAAGWDKAAKDATDGYAVEKQALNQEVERRKTERDALYQRLMALDEEHDKLAMEAGLRLMISFGSG